MLPLLLFLLSLSIPQNAFAQTANTITVVPSIIKLDLHTDKPEAEIFYTNNTRDVVQLSLTTRDFSGISDGGQMNLLDPTSSQTYKYGLSSWVHFDTNAITLNPGEKKSIHITIEKEQLPLGGHYATILAAISPKETTHTVKVQSVLASLLFVRATGAYNREEAKITTLTPDTLFPYFPKNLSVRIENTGNVQVTPYGLIEINDMFGHLAAKGILNEGSFFVLPESIRRFTIPISPLQPFLLPGIYTIHLQMHYSTDAAANKTATSTTTFFSQGSLDLVNIGIGILMVTIGVLLFRKRKK